MPTNLPPEYFRVEELYRSAKTTSEKIAYLEDLLRIVPKHKGTDKLRADLRRRLSKLRDQSKKQKGLAKQTSLFNIEKEGAGQVVLIGFPNVGKSSLLQVLTKARPEVADFPFTTWSPTPGMMDLENIQIQLIDTPPLNHEFIEPEMFNLIRRANLLLLVIALQSTPLNHLDQSLAILKDHNLKPESPKRLSNPDDKMVCPVVVAVNKVDTPELDEDFKILQELEEQGLPLFPVSATTSSGLNELKSALFKHLSIIRVYSKAPGKAPDYQEPFILTAGSTIEDFAAKLHKEFLKKMKTARIWGKEVYEGQMVGRDHILNDEDIVEIRS